MHDLTALYRQELKNYKHLLELTHRLQKVDEFENPQDLETILAERKKTLEKISAFEERIEALKENINDLSAREQQRLAGITNEIRETIKEIVGLDERIGAKLRAEKDDVSHKLSKVRHGRKALKGYAPRRTIPRFLDKRF
ncbi:MAG: flagellar protein FliT [Desulfobacterales bacterium]|nr:flagellar protein FliT [Desulfobacterales bacterium]